MDQCSSCRYFTRPGLAGTRYGVCVRFPRTAEKHEQDFCGEYKPAPTAIKEPASTTGTVVAKPKSVR